MIYEFEDAWSLLSMMRRHQAPPRDFSELVDDDPETLVFEIPAHYLTPQPAEPVEFLETQARETLVEPDEVVALADIGAQVVNINVIANGIPTFTRDITTAGNQYTEEIQKAVQELAQQIYSKAGMGDQAEPPPGFEESADTDAKQSEEASDEEVVEADYEIVDESEDK